MIFDSFGRGFLLTGDAHYRDVVMQASRSLDHALQPARGSDQVVGHRARHTDDGRDWKYPVIVDNMMNLEMLFWAASHGGDSAWFRVAERHALTSARAHVRDDGSTAHIALFDPATGALERTVTWQGYADNSAWARGQAWAIHGFSASYGHTEAPELLAWRSEPPIGSSRICPRTPCRSGIFEIRQFPNRARRVGGGDRGVGAL